MFTIVFWNILGIITAVSYFFQEPSDINTWFMAAIFFIMGELAVIQEQLK